MKSLNRSLAASVLMGGLALTTTPVRGQIQNYIIDQFNDTAEADSWTRWWGSAVQTYEFDPTVDVMSNANSGSLKASVQFDISQYGGDNQFAVQHYFAATDGSRVTLDGSQYTNLDFDIRFDPNSPTRPTLGDFGSSNSA